MCCHWLFPPQPILRQFQSWWAQKQCNKAPSLMTTGELAKATTTWRQAHFGAVMSGSLQLSCSGSGQHEVTTRAASSPSSRWHCGGQKFQLNDVKGPVRTIQKVTIPPFSTINIQANTSVKQYCMQVHTLMELVLGPQLPAAVVPTDTYGELHPGSSRVPVCLCNLSAHVVDVPAKTVVGQIVPAQSSTSGGPPDKDCHRDLLPSTKGMGFWRI